MTDYKALYEKQLEENKKLKEERKWADGLTARQVHEMFLSKEDILKELDYARKTNLENFAGMWEEAKKNEKLEKQNKELKEEKEWARQEGRDEKEAEYDKLAFVIGGQYEPNNPSLMINSVELMKEENKKLKEQVKYWKNFALFYWSGFQLGEEENSDSDVWQEALDQCNSNSECDTEALTKKCMED